MSRCLTFANAFFQEDNFLRITICDGGGLHLLEKLSFICSPNESQSSSECTQGAGKQNAVLWSQIHNVHLVEQLKDCTSTVKLD